MSNDPFNRQIDTLMAWINAQPTDEEIRNGIIEECARAIENYNPHRNWSKDEDMQNQGYYTAGEVQSEIVDLVRALAIPMTDRGSQ